MKQLNMILAACLVLATSISTAGATGTHTTWTAAGERVTTSAMSTVFSTTPVNVTGFSTKAACDTAVGSMNNLPYPSSVGYGIRFQSMVVAECFEVSAPAPAP